MPRRRLVVVAALALLGASCHKACSASCGTKATGAGSGDASASDVCLAFSPDCYCAPVCVEGREVTPGRYEVAYAGRKWQGRIVRGVRPDQDPIVMDLDGLACAAVCGPEPTRPPPRCGFQDGGACAAATPDIGPPAPQRDGS